MITLAVNELIEDIVSEIVYRILWIDEGNMIAYVIEIKCEKALPILFKIKDISQGIIDNTYIKVSNDKTDITLLNDNIPEKMLLHRDKAWNIIRKLVQDEPAIYQEKQRGQYIKELVEDKICTKMTAYKYLRRYWQKGKTINSLIPEYSKSGGKNKSKNSMVKNGRQRLNNSTGIIITTEIKEIFKKAVKKYYFKDKRNSLTFTYKMMIKDDFSYVIRVEDGKNRIVIQDENELPTIRQFRYWFNNEYKIEESIISREGNKKFERDHRAILGSSTYETIGPGSRYQIDATTANVYLISSYNSDWIIGRPIIYFVVDVFTHMITGVYIGLEGPSWAGMMMAIANATSDKKEFCSRYGIEISNEVWPSAHLPKLILGDRGELEGHNVKSLLNGLDVDIENTPSFRPDWKGIVESLFNNQDEKVKPFLPGYIQTDFGERGAEDYRLQAKLTLEQYTKIIIHFILFYNKNHYMRDYPRSLEMIEANIKPKPIELWNWGIKNKGGKLRKESPEKVMFYLMPRDIATVTSKGIKFKRMLYSCELALKESWFVKARSKGSWKVDISYDTRNMDNIYIHTNDEEIFEPCFLLEHQERFKDKIIEEINDLNERESEIARSEEFSILQEEINLFNGIEEIVEESVKNANKTQSTNLTKAEKITNIRVNRKKEKDLRRSEEAFNLTKEDNKHEIEVIEFNNFLQEDGESKMPSIKELFNQRRSRENK